jgi:hypothetical protein
LNHLDNAGVELFKTDFHKLEDWDIGAGWLTRKCLEELELKTIADN